jgi:hypothetical protein
MNWNVEVAQPGEYEAAIYYTCKAADVGSVVELSFGGSKVQGKIGRPNDPPLIGETWDRAKRTESFVKDFQPLILGPVKLQKGKGPLRLRAISVAGKEVAEIRYVTLRRR